ncbi:MAG: 3-isopropylmalate dehydratase large subunit, partial [Ilumatobacteraceae bacterium]
ARRAVGAGDVVGVRADAALGTDGSVPMALDYFAEIGGAEMTAETDIVFALDHYAPPTSQIALDAHHRMREFASTHGVRLYEVGEGIGHQLMVEHGHVRPGTTCVAADSHATTYGALNTFGTGIGSSDLAVLMATGTLWFCVPESIQVDLSGSLGPNVAAKDLALHLVGRLGASGARYSALEFTGRGVETLDLDDRLVVANMAVELGAKAGIFPCDDRLREELERQRIPSEDGITPFDHARYARSIHIDLSSIRPTIATRHRVDATTTTDDLAGAPITSCRIGTCTGGRTKDIRQAVEALETFGGIAPGVNVVVTPASRRVREQLDSEGLTTRLRVMGATIRMPGCGACCGSAGDIPDNDDIVISTANRNYRGRMGNPHAAIMLASPSTAATAAARGAVSGNTEGAERHG